MQLELRITLLSHLAPTAPVGMFLSPNPHGRSAPIIVDGMRGVSKGLKPLLIPFPGNLGGRYRFQLGLAACVNPGDIGGSLNIFSQIDQEPRKLVSCRKRKSSTVLWTRGSPGLPSWGYMWREQVRTSVTTAFVSRRGPASRLGSKQSLQSGRSNVTNRP